MSTTPAITADAAGITTAAAKRTGSVVEQMLAAPDQRVEQIPVDALHEHPDNPRGVVGNVDELAESIRANGILEPLIVARAAAWQKVDDRLPFLDTASDYVVIAGHRRKAAAVQAGADAVPCLVRDDLVGVDAEVAMLVENLQREGLTPLQEAQGFRRLEDQGKSQREIARLVGCNQSNVSKRLGLLKLPDHVQARIAKKGPDGKPAEDAIDVADAVALTKVADAPPSVINGILKRPSWKSLDTAVEEAVEQRDRDRARQARVEQLRAAGITNIVAYPQYGFYRGDKPPTPLEYLEDDGVDVSEHEHFACHAVAVGYSYSNTDLRVVPVCTNPIAHGASKAAKAADTAAKDKARREREEAKRAKRRLERSRIIAGLGNQTNAADVAATVDAVLLETLLDQTWGEQTDEVAAMLQLEVGEDVDSEDAVRAHAKSGPRQRAQVVTTLALVCALDYHGEGRAAVLQLLAGHGYKLDADEKADVKRAASPNPKPQPVEVPAPAASTACLECNHDQPTDGCACPTCFCNPDNVDEPAEAVAG